MNWLHRLTHRLRALLVRVHWAVGRHQWLLARRGVLLSWLRNGWPAVVDWLMMSSGLFLTGFVVRLLLLMVVARVSVRLVHWHCWVVLVTVVGRLRLVLSLLLGRLRVRGLRWLHHVACWRRSILLLLLLLLLLLVLRLVLRL